MEKQGLTSEKRQNERMEKIRNACCLLLYVRLTSIVDVFSNKSKWDRITCIHSHFQPLRSNKSILIGIVYIFQLRLPMCNENFVPSIIWSHKKLKSSNYLLI